MNHNITNVTELVVYKNSTGNIEIEVHLQEETLWLNQQQIAAIFDTQRPAITKHLNNIFRSGELDESKVSSILEHTTKHGAIEGKIQKKHTKYYSLDAVISVGYRVNSQKATQFRIWATSILKNHIIEGYTFNKKRLQEKGLSEFEQAVALIKKTIETKQLTNDEEKGLLKVITEYANSWALLQKYDEQLLQQPKKTYKSSYTLTYDEATIAISELKRDLMRKKEASSLFGQERDEMLQGIIGNLYQTFDTHDVYPTFEEKAANLLYFVIKDHPFSDGNKRIGSFLFILFLARNNHLYTKQHEKKFQDNALVALALLIAESDPKQKDMLIVLIMHFLVGK